MSNLKKIDEAWLNLDGLDERTLLNPFDIVNFNEDDYHLRTMWLMTSQSTSLFYVSIYSI